MIDITNLNSLLVDFDQVISIHTTYDFHNSFYDMDLVLSKGTTEDDDALLKFIFPEYPQ